MEPAKIRELARLMHQEKLTCLEYEANDERIRLECAAPVTVVQGQPGIDALPAAMMFDAAGPQASLDQAQSLADPGMDFNDMNTVTSPMVGVFYAAPAEDQPPYVQVGDKVKQGDTLCIVEAMKVMNEIAASHDGEIVDVCVRNGDVVEFGQPLFKLI